MLHLITMELELLISFCWIWPVWEFPRTASIKIFSSIFTFSRVQSSSTRGFSCFVNCHKQCSRIRGAHHPYINKQKLKCQLLNRNQELKATCCYSLHSTAQHNFIIGTVNFRQPRYRLAIKSHSHQAVNYTRRRLSTFNGIISWINAA